MTNTQKIKIIKAEIPIIEEITRNECWYEGERRHTNVPQDDQVVIQKVLDICIKNGSKIRAVAMQNLKLI